MRVETNTAKFNKHPGAVLVWACSVDTSDIDRVEKGLEIDHLPYDQRYLNRQVHKDGCSCRPCILGVKSKTIQEELQIYTGSDARYGCGDTVALHMISVAVLLGLKDVQVIGMDLDYRKGYAKNDRGVSPLDNAHQEVTKHRDRITKDMGVIYRSAKMVGAVVRPFGMGSPYLNETLSKLSDEL